MASPFRPAADLLVQYARYHRDQRNIATHFVGIPLIVLGIGVLLARTHIAPGDVDLSLAWLLWGLSTGWYMTRGLPLLGLATSLLNAILMAAAQPFGQGSIAVWLSAGVGFFVLGWIIQFVGHFYEGRKPAFADDLVGLLVGPMFITAEAMFSVGWQPELLHRIEQEAGAVRLRDLSAGT